MSARASYLHPFQLNTWQLTRYVFEEMAENLSVKTGTALYVASKRLKETKRNVTEQVKIAEDYVDKLHFLRSNLISRLNKECELVECQVELLMKKLEEKKVAVIEELRRKTNEDLETMSACIELAKTAILKTNEVGLWLALSCM